MSIDSPVPSPVYSVSIGLQVYLTRPYQPPINYLLLYGVIIEPPVIVELAQYSPRSVTELWVLSLISATPPAYRGFLWVRLPHLNIEATT